MGDQQASLSLVDPEALTLMTTRRYVVLLTALIFITSLFTTGWYIEHSWKKRINKKNKEISKLKDEVKAGLDINKSIKRDHNLKIVQKDEEIGQLRQAHEQEITEKNEELDRIGIELSSRGQRSNEKIQKVRGFLKSQGSPMASTAEELVRISESYQIDPFLLVGIAGVESSFGKRCYGFNPFGYLQNGAGSGLRRYKSWVDGYIAICKFIRSNWGKSGKVIYSSSQLRGYCFPDHPWMEKVEAIKKRL